MQREECRQEMAVACKCSKQLSCLSSRGTGKQQMNTVGVIDPRLCIQTLDSVNSMQES